MKSRHYILKDGKVVPATLMAWAKWFETSERIVKQEQVGNSKVSTVFLGLDHSFLDEAPVLWETMVFGGKLDLEMERCSGNREQAEAMHELMVKRVKEHEAAQSKG